jgi:uncharacterized protein involved in outer membrane biogenesis
MSADDPDIKRRLTRKRAEAEKTSEGPEPRTPPEAAASAPKPLPETHETPPEAAPATSPRSADWPDKAKAAMTAGAVAVWAFLKRIPGWIRWAVLAILIVIVAIFLFLANPNWDWAKPTVASMASGRLHRPVAIDGHLTVHLFRWTPDATVTGVRVGEPDWAHAATKNKNLADIDTLAVTAEMMPLLYGHVVLPRLEVTRPSVTLFQDKAGRANWDFSNGANPGQPTKLPPIKNFIITDGHLTLTSLSRRMVFTGTVDAHEKANSGRTAFALLGNGSLNGHVFQMNATGGPLLNVRTNIPYPFAMDVRAGDTRILANGQVTHPFNLGQLDGTVKVSGRNLGDLYAVTGLSFPDTPPYTLSAKVTRQDQVYDIGRIIGRVGASDLEGTLKVDTRNHGRPYLTGDLSSRVLDFKDLGSLVGATSANRPGKAQVSMAPTAPQAARRLMPDATLDIERIRGMDAKVRYRAAAIRAPGLPLRQVSVNISLDHGLLVLDPIDLSFPQGRLQGLARLDARDAVQKNTVDVRVTNLNVQQWLPKLQGQPPLEGLLNARLRVSGTGNSVHKAAASANGDFTVVMPGGTVRQSLAELAGIDASKGLFLLLAKSPHQTDVRCAVADFSVQNGIMQARQVVVDTGVVRVDGSGHINLNDESLKLVLKGKPKQFRLVRVNAPIVIGGHLGAPAIGIDAGPPLIQAGLAGVLQSILPFVGLDQAKDANCGALLADAHAQGAPVTKAIPKKR